MIERKSTLIGTVQDVNGADVGIVLDDVSLSGLIFVDGKTYKVGQIGSFVKIPLGFSVKYGIVNQVGASAVPETKQEDSPHGNRWMRINLVGESDRVGNFQRGVSKYPTIGDEVHVVSDKDLMSVYGEAEGEKYVQIGNLSSAENLPGLINIDKLVSRHALIVGSTGAGKSNTVTCLLRAITEQNYPNSKILLIDLHSEYSSALADRSKVFNKSGSQGNKLKIPFWFFSYPELAKVFFDRRSSVDTQNDFIIQERILKDKLKVSNSLKSGSVDENKITINSPIPFDIKQVWYDLFIEEFATVNTKGDLNDIAYKKDDSGTEIIGNPEKMIPPEFEAPATGDVAPWKYKANRPLSRYLDLLKGKLIDTRYDFLFETDEYDGKNKDLGDLLDEWFNHDKPITILDLGGIPHEEIDIIIGSISRICYETSFWGREMEGIGRKRPLMIVYEEAHNYLPKGGSSSDVQGFATHAVRKICKEGRKYGVGSLIVSQRPSELDESIISQCGSFLSLRLSNSNDQGIIRSAIPDNSSGLSEMLPSLRTGETIVIGECVNIPSRIKIPLMEPRPDSNDPLPSQTWTIEKKINPEFANAVTKWRKQE